MLEKKRWFVGYSTTLWVPVTLEGWVVIIAFIAGLYLVYQLNGVSGDVPFDITLHWPVIVEMLVVIIGFFWISKGHVDKRY